MKILAITTGDPDGVGPEVTVKALLTRGPRRDFRPVVFRSRESEKGFAKLAKKFRRVIVTSLADALEASTTVDTVVEIVDGTEAPFWVDTAAKACLGGRIDGMVTGPLSKTLIRDCGFRDLGHTEILSRLSGKKDLFQGYLGDRFNVVLATAHLPLKSVPGALTPARLRKSLAAADRFRRRLPRAARGKPIAMLGLNPHAGESGLLGREELVFRKVISSLRGGIPVEGPLVPDAAFVEENWNRYSVFVAAYHDQGLIPFKMLHGRRSGAQLTLGLPFIRTSVDHGTAKDIAGRGKADAGSMRDAIEWGLRLASRGKGI